MRRFLLGFAMLVGALAVIAPGEGLAMSDHSAHAKMHDAATDSDVADAESRPAMVHHGEMGHEGGGCRMGMMGACCVMTCCAVTAPEIPAEVVRHLVIPARSSRPPAAPDRTILPPLRPPIRLS